MTDQEVKAASEVIAAHVTTDDDLQQDFCIRVAREALTAAEETRKVEAPSASYADRFQEDHWPR